MELHSVPSLSLIPTFHGVLMQSSSSVMSTSLHASSHTIFFFFFAFMRIRATPWLKAQTSTEASLPAITESSATCMLLS